MIDKKELEKLRHKFPKGTRVVLVQMDDKYAPPVGTKGTVQGIDDIGSIIVNWDNGSTLNALYEIDIVKKCWNMNKRCK